MKKFDVDISITVKDEGGYSQPMFWENVNAKGITSRALFTLLYFIFKITEPFSGENK